MKKNLILFLAVAVGLMAGCSNVEQDSGSVESSETEIVETEIVETEAETTVTTFETSTETTNAVDETTFQSFQQIDVEPMEFPSGASYSDCMTQFAESLNCSSDELHSVISISSDLNIRNYIWIDGFGNNVRNDSNIANEWDGYLTSIQAFSQGFYTYMLESGTMDGIDFNYEMYILNADQPTSNYLLEAVNGVITYNARNGEVSNIISNIATDLDQFAMGLASDAPSNCLVAVDNYNDEVQMSFQDEELYDLHYDVDLGDSDAIDLWNQKVSAYQNFAQDVYDGMISLDTLNGSHFTIVVNYPMPTGYYNMLEITDGVIVFNCEEDATTVPAN